MPSTHRLTPQRRIILEELRKTRTHPTADELYDQVRKRLPHISLGTIYRNLDFLHSQGLVLKLDKVGPQMRFDAFTDPHLHLRCQRCGSVVDLPQDAVSVSVQVQDESACEIQGHWIELFGMCSKCKTGRGKVARQATA